MDRLSIYKVELKEMHADSCRYTYELDDAFFADIEAPEIRKGRLRAVLEVRKGIEVYRLSFHIEGTVVVPCDRCLDDLELAVDTDDRLTVRLGAAFRDEDDQVVVPEEEGFINVAWYLYEFIELSLPMQHVHPDGECNPAMMEALRSHLSVEACEADGEEDAGDGEDTDGMPGSTDPRWDALKKILNNNNK